MIESQTSKSRTRSVTLAASAAVVLGVAGCGSTSQSKPSSAAQSSSPNATGSRSVVEASVVRLDASALTVTLPLHQGLTASGGTTWYIVTDSSNAADAKARGVNYAPKIANALGTKAVQSVTTRGGEIVFPGTVRFGLPHVVKPGPQGFPPTVAKPGAEGDPKYSPLINIGNGVVIDAPQVANSSGQNNSVTSIDYTAHTVTLKLLDGWANGVHNFYLRTDGSVPLLAAIESSTYAPNLNAAPGLASDNPARSARSAIIPIVNGPRAAEGANERQGLDSALLGEGTPQNIEQDPTDTITYSPIWDVSPAVWTKAAIAAHKRVRLTSARAVAAGVRDGTLVSGGTGPANSSLGGLRAAAFISNCSIVAIG
jgi:hypothetical protein